jgi:7-carboxy-7-deazaguanine synthase
MKVNEIFFSIQGESSFAGCPCAFIRLSACDLRCSYCDTAYAFFEGTEIPLGGILEAIAGYPTRLVLVTGGEPMIQRGIHDLLGALLTREYTACLETGGHVSLRDVDPRVHKIMDLKCPSSGMESRNDYSNIDLLSRIDEVKFVIGDRLDFEWAAEKTSRFDLAGRVGSVLFSPVYGKLPYDLLARWLLDSGLRARMQLQLHKIIWPEIPRGV